jgi:hypothetical protein
MRKHIIALPRLQDAYMPTNNHHLHSFMCVNTRSCAPRRRCRQSETRARAFKVAAATANSMVMRGISSQRKLLFQWDAVPEQQV